MGIQIGARIKELRERANLSQVYVAQQLGLHVTSLSYLENNRTAPTLKRLEKLAEILEVSVGTFFDQPGSNLESDSNKLKMELQQCKEENTLFREHIDLLKYKLKTLEK